MVASMEREGAVTRVLVHRSEDQGKSWQLVETIEPPSGHREIVDPVLSCDPAGNFYITVMRVNAVTDPTQTTVDLDLYRSTDDGQSWAYMSSPHEADVIADYPQLITGQAEELFLVYSHIEAFPLVDTSRLNFRKSIDGGANWSDRQELGPDILHCIGPDISWSGGGDLLATAGDLKAHKIYSLTSDDRGNTWTLRHTFANPDTGMAHITKPIAHPDHEFFGILSHKPHQENSPIIYHAWQTDATQSIILGEGAYAQGYMDEDGKVHVIFNRKKDNQFTLNYTTSIDGGFTFSEPIVLLSGDFSSSAFGEYQSFLRGNDGQFYLFFCDWRDQSKAKLLTFAPTITDVKRYDPIGLKVFPNPTTRLVQLEIPESFDPMRLHLLDLQGRKLKSIIVNANAEKLEVDLADLARGTYLLQLEEVNRFTIVSVVKM